VKKLPEEVLIGFAESTEDVRDRKTPSSVQKFPFSRSRGLLQREIEGRDIQ
jgi:hypothetical protein